MSGPTLPSILLERARREPDAVAMRVKRGGIYRDISWAQYRDRVGAICFGLRSLGLKPEVLEKVFYKNAQRGLKLPA